MIAISSHVNPASKTLCHAKCVRRPPLPMLLNTGAPLKTRLFPVNVLSITAATALANPFPSARWFGRTPDYGAREKCSKKTIIFITASYTKEQQERTEAAALRFYSGRATFVAELIYLLFEEMWLLFISYFVWCPRASSRGFLLHAECFRRRWHDAHTTISSSILRSQYLFDIFVCVVLSE